MLDDQIKLLGLQQNIEQESIGKSIVGLSIDETIRACLIGGLSKRADKVRSNSKVPTSGPSFPPVFLKALAEKPGSGTSR